MTTFEELENCVKQNDAMSFLICYLKLLNQNESLDLPKSTNKKDLEMEWEDILPPNCKNGLPSFYSALSTLWLSLLQTPNLNESDNLIKTLLETLEHNQQASQPKEGGIFVTKSDDYSLENKLLTNPLPKENILQEINIAINKKDSLTFLENYCYLCIIDTTFTLPQRTTQEHIENEWSIILNKITSSHSMPITEISKIYFNLIHTHGIPNNNNTIILFYKSLTNKKKAT